MKIRIFLSFVFLCFILLIFFFGLNNNNKYESINLVGKKISNFELKRLNKDTNYNIKNLSSSNFTLINFWSSWCAPCREEHKYLMLLKKNANIKILGINFKDNKNNAFKFLENLGNPYDDILRDIDGKGSVIFGIYGIPESILVDSDLMIIKKYIGPISKKEYKEILQHIKK